MSSMLQDIKEIGTSLSALMNVSSELMDLGSLFRGVNRLFLVGAGSSYYASIYAASHALRGGLGKLVYATPSSEFIYYYSKLVDSSSLVVGVSRSGETAETLEALRVAKGKGAGTMMLSISKGGSSFIDHYVVVDIGQERSVVMTKSFVTLSAAASILVNSIVGNMINCDVVLRALSNCVSTMINEPRFMKVLTGIVNEWIDGGVRRFIFLGHGSSYPIALESALKFEEMSYASVQSLNTLEFRHGPIATVGERQAIVMLNQLGSMSSSAIKLFNELRGRSRGTETRVLMVTNVNEVGDDVVNVDCNTGIEEWDSLALVVPIYLMAHQYASGLGINIESPRNLVRVVKEF